MSGHSIRRLERLEAALLPPHGPAALRALTDDELEVSLLDASRALACDPGADAEEHALAVARVASIEDGIRFQAGLHRRPSYADHVARLAATHPGYVPAVCAPQIGHGLFSDVGFAEYADLDKPRIMGRRAALRARPDIARLIEEGSRT